jgi:hypothetical protein
MPVAGRVFKPDFLILFTISIFLLAVFCHLLWEKRVYTSRDLARLPCESEKKIFFPIEFDEKGEVLYQEQWESFTQKLKPETSLSDVYIFIHGWDKTIDAAENDYRDFVCRFYQGPGNQLSQSDNSGAGSNPLVVGIFWPSTMLANFQDPALIKPITYFIIRNRADILQATGIQKTFRAIYDANNRRNGSLPLKLHFIGHSFGGRILIKGLSTFLKTSGIGPHEWFASFSTVDLILLLPAIPPSDIVNERDLMWKIQSKPDTNSSRNTSPPEASGSYKFHFPGIWPSARIFVVHSSNDLANRFLFRLGGLYGTDPMVCAAGACGVPNMRRSTVNEAGSMGPIEPAQYFYAFNVWNIDASKIISDHGDIYKGRVATLLWQLINHNSWKG